MKRNYDKDYMRSTNEDYRNGYRDAEQSTLNLFKWAMIIVAVVGFLFGFKQ